MQVATAQLPAIKDSDDKVFTTPQAVVILDGASTFVPVPVPAAIYADHLGSKIAELLTEQPRADLRDVLARAIESSARSLGLKPGKSPSSTVAMLRQSDDFVDLLILGDTTAALPVVGVLTDERIDNLDLEPRRKYRERLVAGMGYDEAHRELLRELQAEEGRHRNQPGGFWIAEATPEAAQHAITARYPLSTVPWAVLTTDGAFNTMSFLGLTDWPKIAQANADQLSAILEQCQQWEHVDDPDGRQVPRAKRHDDKAVVAVRLSSSTLTTLEETPWPRSTPWNVGLPHLKPG